MWRDHLMALVAGLAATMYAVWRRRRKASADQSAFKSGLPVSFRANLRQLDAPKPAWRSGTVHLTPAHLTWSPRCVRSAPISIEPTTAHVLGIRRLKGAEPIRFDTDLRVLTFTTLGSRLDLAVYPEYLDLISRIVPLPDHDLLPEPDTAPLPEEPNSQ